LAPLLTSFSATVGPNKCLLPLNKAFDRKNSSRISGRRVLRNELFFRTIEVTPCSWPPNPCKIGTACEPVTEKSRGFAKDEGRGSAPCYGDPVVACPGGLIQPSFRQEEATLQSKTCVFESIHALEENSIPLLVSSVRCSMAFKLASPISARSLKLNVDECLSSTPAIADQAEVQATLRQRS
jgi:hypothetical protein